MRVPPLDKLAFVVSLAVFAFLYGVAAQAFDWFPTSLLREAWNQAEARTPLSTALFTGGQPQPETGMGLSRRDYDRQGARVVREDQIQPGLTFIASDWEFPGGLAPGLRLIDRDGNTVHEWRIAPAEVFADTVDRAREHLWQHYIHGAFLFPDGDVMVNIEYVGTARLDACGRVKWRQSTANSHHSMAAADDGTFWVSGVLRSQPAMSTAYEQGYPGLEGPIHQDLAVRIGEDGEVLETVNILDVLYDNGLERYIPHGRLIKTTERPYGEDVLHMNDVEPLSGAMAPDYPEFEAGDLLVSLRELSLVFVFDPETGMVRWHAHTPFIHQHDPDFAGGGWVGVFDNNGDNTERGSMLGGSRIVMLKPGTDSMRVVFPTARSEPFYTYIRGKWQQLDNGNLLLTEANPGRVVEVDPEGRTVWEWIRAPASDSTVYAVTGATRVALTAAQAHQWPCSPSTVSQP